jgi:hypothetical protein
MPPTLTSPSRAAEREATAVARRDSIMLRVWLAGCALMWTVTAINLLQALWNRFR